LSGIVVATGKDVEKWSTGNRVTVPFVCGCGSCTECASGNHQVCINQFQPGFTGWGSFAELVSIRYADTNLVGLPDSIDFPTAASLGCRFATSFRALVDQARVAPGQWVAIFGCGGVGLSAVMIARACDAQVVAVDVNEQALELAKSLGAVATVNASGRSPAEIVEAVRDITDGGAHVSVDALGHSSTSQDAIGSLRRRGKHVQIGLMTGDHACSTIPWGPVVAWELQVIGSHGMQAHRYPAMLALLESGKLQPERLIGKRISLADSIDELIEMPKNKNVGISVIERF
jgi:alcohol dehydrogenase